MLKWSFLVIILNTLFLKLFYLFVFNGLNLATWNYEITYVILLVVLSETMIFHLSDKYIYKKFRISISEDF